jgi:hypothetical protein
MKAKGWKVGSGKWTANADGSCFVLCPSSTVTCPLHSKGVRLFYPSGFLLGMPARRGYPAGVGAIFFKMTR